MGQVSNAMLGFKALKKDLFRKFIICWMRFQSMVVSLLGLR